jgi:hypothetical protein
MNPWNTVIHEQLTVQLVKKFPAVYGIQRFIIVLTKVDHWFLSSGGLIHSMLFHPIS